ncbi:MAG: KpsF/GutQ family sugar-phosphate isomerase [Deltaproteobacteria bacterium]|nr:KpsF/GutQ family sugar-phosphate isomerase [Deltaproteobacteria bacterium]
MSDILKTARQTLEIEIEGLRGLIPRLGEPFEKAARMMFACTGRVAVSGIGKSGHVSRKIAATLASTGTPAFFLHPAEALHGDLGMVTRQDVVLALSNSGQTEELVRLLAPLRRIGVPIISMTGNPASELARRAEIHLDVSVAKEACPLGLAPTASTTAALAMGDTLAVALLNMRNFREEDFALFHPGGSLGKKLVTTVADLMETGNRLPVVRETDPLSEVIPVMLDKNYGITAVVDGNGQLTGVFSLGDLTRMHLKDPSLGFLHKSVTDFMTRTPRTISPDALAAAALNIMETLKIRALIAVDPHNRPAGIIGLYEVLKAIDY